MISKAEATTAILEAKKAKGLTYEELSTEIGQDKVWTAAAVMGSDGTLLKMLVLASASTLG